MGGNTTGVLFRVTTFGESHSPATGAVVDGCPSGLPLDASVIQRQLDRRRPGASPIASARREDDVVQILSGVESGFTLGTPIGLVIPNQDARPADYAALAHVYRPSHADYTTEAKYGRRSRSGGGRASARETAARVAAGAIAAHWLALREGVAILAWVASVGELEARVDTMAVTQDLVDANAVRCPDADAARAMHEAIDQARRDGDSLGGVVCFRATGVPPGLGEPVFDKLEAELAKALLSIPAARGMEIGSGFAGTRMRGSEHNDRFVSEGGRIRTATNRSGGIQGGISNGEAIWGRVAFKPTATINHPQDTVDRDGRPVILAATGRHDPCVVPRAVPIVEAMVALVLADHRLRQLAVEHSRA